MAVIKVYTRINWLNKSESLTTPLGKTNLNKMDKAINLIDDEVVSMSAKIDEIDTTKVSADQLNNMVTDVSFNDKNGVISITKYNGTVLNIDTAMEKIAVNFEYNAQTQQLILTLENGEKQYIDMSALITQYEFKGTDTIAFSIDSSGKVSASIKSGSITKAMLSSEVMSAITLSENNAAASAQAAAQSATNAEIDAKMSQSYAIGGSGIREGEDTNNSKYYSETAAASAIEAKKSEDVVAQNATNALASENEARNQAQIATTKADEASTSATNAKTSETNATTSATNASASASAAATSATKAGASEKKAAASATNAELDAKLSQSYSVGKSGIRDGEDTDNAKYYYHQAKAISESFSGALRPMGTVTFANLPSVSSAAEGDMYNVSDQFTTTSDFKEGSGNVIPQGSNVYKTSDGKWDVLAGSPVTGVKGAAETRYRRGNVNITLENLGIEDASTSKHGLMTAAMVTKLNGIATGANKTTVDSALSSTSTNPVQNKVITRALQQKADKTEVPKLVKVDGKTVFLSEDGVLSAKGGGSSIKPKPVSDVSIVSAKSKVTIKWTDPTDIVVDGAVLSQWQKTVLMYKQGTVPPTSLNDGTIAVEETTRNQYQSTGYGISLADGYDYSFSLFAISTDGTSSDKVSVSAKLYATLTVTTEEASLYGKAVTVTSGSQKVTGTFSNRGSVTLRIPWMGNTTISATDGTDTTTTTVNITKYGKSYNAELSFVKIVTFADGTDEEIAKMVEAHYNNKINIADYWSVGDKRSVNLSAMSATYVKESHRAQTVEMAIADFDHDDLTTAINGHTKAAVTLTQVDCLMDASNASNPVNGSKNTENGYMNSSNTNVGGWKNCARRTWCNSVYYNALPSVLKNAVKEVNKKTSAGNKSTTINTTADKIFLLSEIEIFGNISYSVVGEGKQYQYFKNATANRYKMPKMVSSSNSNIYWERSPHSGDSGLFCYVSDDGSASWGGASHTHGVAPCFCI